MTLEEKIYRLIHNSDLTRFAFTGWLDTPQKDNTEPDLRHAEAEADLCDDIMAVLREVKQ